MLQHLNKAHMADVALRPFAIWLSLAAMIQQQSLRLPLAGLAKQTTSHINPHLGFGLYKYILTRQKMEPPLKQRMARMFRL